MLREGDTLDPFKKFQTAGKLAKTVAHWKTKGGTLAVREKNDLRLLSSLH